MSGGSMNYVYSTLEEYAVGMMKDAELDEMMADIANLLHACEWWHSGDYSEGQYREKANQFKKKWLGDMRTREARLERIIDEKANELRKELRKMIGR